MVFIVPEKIIFLGPNLNKLRLYDELPTLKTLKDQIISEIFEGIIINPVLTYVSDDISFTVFSENDLKDAFACFKSEKKPIRFTVANATLPIVNKVETVTKLVVTAPGKAFSPLRATAAPYRPQHVTNRKARIPKLGGRFIGHISVPDNGSTVYSGITFSKTWRFKNEGDFPWPKMILASFVSKLTGDKMGAPESLEINFPQPIKIGQEVDITVPFVAPALPGQYSGYWKLQDQNGKNFSQRVRALIQVEVMPQAKELLDNSVDEKTKAKRLACLFPDLLYRKDEFIFMDCLYLDSDPVKKGSLKEVLEGVALNENGQPYSMDSIIHTVCYNHSEGQKKYPWD